MSRSEDNKEAAIEVIEDGIEQRRIDKRIGNEFWKARSSHGRKPIFAKPEDLQEGIDQYFQWCIDYPLYEVKPMVVDKVLVMVDVPLIRATTRQGLVSFLDINSDTWYEYDKREGFTEVITRAMERMYSQKFSGAAAGQLNANIIARDLGLSEKVDNKHAGHDGGALPMQTVFVPVGKDYDPTK